MGERHAGSVKVVGSIPIYSIACFINVVQSIFQWIMKLCNTQDLIGTLQLSGLQKVEVFFLYVIE